MALPVKNTKTTEIAGLDTFYNGGKGSGNFGHSGRPGERGGSGNGGGGFSKGDEVKKLAKDFVWLKATKHTSEIAEEKIASYKARVEEIKQAIEKASSEPKTPTGRIKLEAQDRIKSLRQDLEKAQQWTEYWTDAKKLLDAGYKPTEK